MSESMMDREVLKARGISEEKYNEELRRLKVGFPWLRIEGAATVGNGILRLDPEQRAEYVKVWDEYRDQGAKVVKMVPASGAASRMFKAVFAYAGGGDMTDFMQQFMDGVHRFAFYPELDAACQRLYGKSVDQLIADGEQRKVAQALIYPEGLNYGQLPKALLLFHSYDGGARTALEEHMAEGAQYAACSDGSVHLHFTVSEDHIPLFKQRIAEALPAMEREFGKKYDISLSVQKPSTDTVALGPDGKVFRQDGKLFFRPGGHGALIENLAEIDGDVIFIKNVDNVVPDTLRASTV